VSSTRQFDAMEGSWIDIIEEARKNAKWYNAIIIFSGFLEYLLAEGD